MNILPDSRSRTVRGSINSPMGNMVPVFCANCGKSGGWCPEENMTFLFYQCEPCARTYGHVAGTYLMPDEVFWREVQAAQIDKYGRTLNEQETLAALSDPLSLESLLAKHREALTPNPGT